MRENTPDIKTRLRHSPGAPLAHAHAVAPAAAGKNPVLPGPVDHEGRTVEIIEKFPDVGFLLDDEITSGTRDLQLLDAPPDTPRPRTSMERTWPIPGRRSATNRSICPAENLRFQRNLF